MRALKFPSEGFENSKLLSTHYSEKGMLMTAWSELQTPEGSRGYSRRYVEVEGRCVKTRFASRRGMHIRPGPPHLPVTHVQP